MAGSRISKIWSSWLCSIQRKDTGGHKCCRSLAVCFSIQPKTPVLGIFSTTVKVGPPTPMNLTAIIPRGQAHPRACLDDNQYWPWPFPKLLLWLENSGLLLFSSSSPSHEVDSFALPHAPAMMSSEPAKPRDPTLWDDYPKCNPEITQLSNIWILLTTHSFINYRKIEM